MCILNSLLAFTNMISFSVPFGHLYFPDVGLVETFKMNKMSYKYKRVPKTLSWHRDGYCDLDKNDEYFNSPFPGN